MHKPILYVCVVLLLYFYTIPNLNGKLLCLELSLWARYCGRSCRPVRVRILMVHVE